MTPFPPLQKYVNLDAIAKTLRGQYPEYSRKKATVFQRQVEVALIVSLRAKLKENGSNGARPCDFSNDKPAEDSFVPSEKRSATTSKKAKAQTRFPVWRPNVQLADLVGYEEAVKTVRSITRHLAHPCICEVMGRAPPRGGIIHGPPGCGKKTLVKAIAAEQKVPIIAVDGIELVNGISGESEGLIRQAFEQAMASVPCILFFDNLEIIAKNPAYAQKDMEVRMGVQLLSCLGNLESSPAEIRDQIIVFGATDSMQDIDPQLAAGHKLGE